MFTDYYNLSDLPFAEGKSIAPILRDERFENGLARLGYFLKGGNLAILTGPTGVGKSSLLNYFADGLPGNRYQVIYLHLTHVKSTSLLRMLVTALGEKPRMGKDRLFGQILQKVSDGDQVTILSIDEAHLGDIANDVAQLSWYCRVVLEPVHGPEQKLSWSRQSPAKKPWWI